MQGVGGEKEQAQRLFEKLISKSDFSLEDLDLDEKKAEWYVLNFHGDEEKKLLVQVVYQVTDSTEGLYYSFDTLSGRKSKTKLELKCTAAEKLEIDFLFAFYRRLYEEEKKVLLEAFIQKHRIFGNLKEGEKAPEISAEELLRLQRMMNGLSDEEPHKALKEKF